jgi:hypothetical protein
MAAQMGMSLVDSWGDYQMTKIQTEAQEKIQAYRNTMNMLSAARSQNAITTNQVRVRDAAKRAEEVIQRTALIDQSKAEVNAAAAGVAGNSVEMTMRDLRASAGRASYAQRRAAFTQMADMSEQKTSVAIAAITNTDVQVIPKPSAGMALLGAGTNLLNIYDSHQPEGSRLLE